MEYSVVTIEEKHVVGIGTRTGNAAPDCMDQIAAVWRDFMKEDGACRQLSPKPGTLVYGIYTNYNWQEQSYDMLAACESETCPAGFRKIVIPAGRYACFTFRGDVREATANAWAEVWNTPLARAFGVDFEEYDCPDDSNMADIRIYVGLADLCQSCGMPMTKPEQHGTNADGSPSADYCAYCYQNGAFTADCTMEGMIDFCLNMPGSEQFYPDRDAARAQMGQYFPSLKRWKE